MLFHLTITHSVEDCPGYNHERMPEVLESMENIESTLDALNIKCHFWVEGLPEHVAYALVEADGPIALAKLTGAIPYRADFKVTAVVHLQEVQGMVKSMMAGK